METGRRLAQTTALMMLAVTILVGAAGTFVGLPPGAIAATAVSFGAIVALVALASVDYRPEAVGTDAVRLVDVLGRELERSRRHEQALTVARVPAGSDAKGALAAAVGSRLRLIDEAVAEGGWLYLVLPGTDGPAAAACLHRLAEVHPALVPPGQASTASFPRDGVTVAGLLGVLEGREPSARPADLPSLDRHRRITVDLTTITTDALTAAAPADVTESIPAESTDEPSDAAGIDV